MPIKVTKETAVEISKAIAKAVKSKPRGGLWAEKQKAKGGK